jgi:hypothetical protein
MKTDLNSLKKELKRLADTPYIKKELHRLAGEIKKFDLSASLTPQARQRLTRLERRFREVLKRLAEIQKEVDSSFESFVKLVRKNRGTSSAARGSAKKKTSKKKATRKAGKRK